MPNERVQSIVNKEHELIIHIGRDGIPSTRFTVYTKELAKEVRDALDKFIKDSK